MCYNSCHVIINFCRVKTSTVNGTTYPKKAVVVCGFADYQPVFGVIEEIIVTPIQECLFVLRPLVTHLNRHFHCFEVEETSSHSFVCRHRVTLLINLCIYVSKLVLMDEFVFVLSTIIYCKEVIL